MDEKRKESSDKRETIQYFEIFFGLFNSFVMGSMIWIAQNNILLAIPAYIFTLIMVIGIILTFKKKNPFFTYFTMGTLVCGSYYALPGLFLIPLTSFKYGIFDYIIFGLAIPEIFYLIFLTKDLSFFKTWGKQALIWGRDKFDSSLPYALMDPETLSLQQQRIDEAILKQKQERNKYNKKYHKSLILSVCIISVLGFYSFFFSSMGL
ncbi:MAG: hypothetical protein ACFE94_05515 [Candidatus Hodarchaeota archaeon]